MKVQHRINNVTFALILAVTLIIDGLGFLLALTVVGSIIGIFMGVLAGIILWVIFMAHGVKYSGTAGLKKIAATFGTMVLEMIPMINALPMVTVGAVIVVLQSRTEDREEAKKKEAERKKQLKLQRIQVARQRALAKRAANDNAAIKQQEAA
ncbi:MAG: hypothetical protein AAB921_02090 [Patescibacteria group bacterium]